jgi:hypothetical protein
MTVPNPHLSVNRTLVTKTIKGTLEGTLTNKTTAIVTTKAVVESPNVDERLELNLKMQVGQTPKRILLPGGISISYQIKK